MGRDELRRACETHGIPAQDRSRTALAARLLEASGAPDSARPRGIFEYQGRASDAPKPGDIAIVRHRQYLIENVAASAEGTDLTKVDLVCLDDDNQGRRLSVLWELELGARVQRPESEGLGEISGADQPSEFAAYLNALRWNSVTATERDLFQSPFRAGIQVLNHQLIPLKKALELPRANLFIADDVGLGKTIEAGLILSELELRQRVEFVLIVCPASICLQWQREMMVRFGQRFEIYDRNFVAARRRERGFGVIPWNTHNRFIISYQMLRRPEYIEPLREVLGERRPKSLLVLDEAHTVAPASSSQYAVDSQTTRAARDLTPRFENRLFLSATPHNGHSNSFSALMELLDPQRFTRGVPVVGSGNALEQVMVRRLKKDLRSAGVAGSSFPERKVIRLTIPGEPPELELGRLLRRYSEFAEPRKGRGKLVFIHLQKRLLSSVDAFYRTLEVHAARILDSGARRPPTEAQTIDLSTDEPSAQEEPEATIDADEDALDRALDHQVEQASTSLPKAAEEAEKTLRSMIELSRGLRNQADAKVRALVEWIAANMLPGASLDGAQGKGSSLEWSDKRLIIFTEYADTKRYLEKMLRRAIEGSRDAEERILGFHGAMNDEERERVARHFNGDPKTYPVRILIATDAAREGLNLQNYCADLFHFDIPWNPARMEQRNGRIDRTLQPSPEVRCHYFVYENREEDAVLERLVKKVETIQEELGSLGDVVLARIEGALAQGIRPGTEAALAELEPKAEAKATVQDELEKTRQSVEKLRKDTDLAAKIFERSARFIQFSPERLRAAVDVGLSFAQANPLTPTTDTELGQGQTAYLLPPLGDNWQTTLDTLRPPRERDEPVWEWRKRPPQPVVFKPLQRIGNERVHLHLEHPFVQRILSRLRAQGTSADDLHRVAVVPNPKDGIVRVLAFGRVSLFGEGATRLHDEIVGVAAQWFESKGSGHLKPFAEDADRRALESLDELLLSAHELPAVSPEIITRLLGGASLDFSALWPALVDEAEARAHAARQKLSERGYAEAEALRELLRAQKEGIRKALTRQLNLYEPLTPEEQAQWEGDREHMQKRLTALEKELETEPPQIEALYRVALERLEPVGLVYLWPTTRMG
ncbi:MAG: hypothetical protein B6A08_03290 [Sorangiineae bacterium NIC37A_2]|nr:MAG: hypothetical protein B6A08_03290 [Sorangiineae bacterium NIC37A_2]